MGPQVGWADASLSDTQKTVDLSDWAGRYVIIEPEGENVKFCFMADTSTTLDTNAASVGTVGVPERVFDGQPGKHRVVPPARPILRYVAESSGTHTLRVIPI